MEQEKKKSTYNREKYEQNKEKILAYRKKRYRELNAYKYAIQINEGIFILQTHDQKRQDGEKGLKQTQRGWIFGESLA